MKTASLNELKNELLHLKPDDVIALCMRLAKFKKENKELLTYLLFEAIDEKNYVDGIKKEIDEQFEGMNKSNSYYAKKTLRKILRFTNRFIKYSGSKQTEVNLLIYFCIKMKKSGLPIRNNTVISNLFQRQIQRIKKALSTLHEDLQFDYQDDLESLG
ncbi:MAG: hypothetical protein AB9846_06615 [Tenuifilaceae bacterium]